ncbi:MAG: nucleotidyltransferase domain-containing protein [Pseudomonadota bacterium]
MKEEPRIRDIAERFSFLSVYLFGSQAEQGMSYLQGEPIEQSAYSDLDIAVTFKTCPTSPIGVYGKIYLEISKLFEPFVLDLVFMHEVSSLFQYEIIKGIKIYTCDERLADEFEERIMKQAEDLLFKQKVFDREVMEAIKDGYIEFEYHPHS